MNKNYLLLIILIFFTFEVNSSENKVFIKKSVNEHIITNIDIDNEINFITVLNPKLVNVDRKKINKYAENNLVNEKIKISELSKFYEINNSDSLSSEIIMRFARRLEIDDLEEFKYYLKKNNIDFKDFLDKIYIEHLWNLLIYKKYNNQVKIDEESIKKNLLIELESQNQKQSYFLYEIIYSVSNESEIEIKKEEIVNSIKKIGFENTASLLSVSQSAKFNGELGWVEENQLSQSIKNEIIKLSIGNYTNPIKIRDGYIILYLKDKKIEKEDFDIDEKFKKQITFERNRKLNEFSRQYFKKIAINQQIE
tara:strand:+ start:327 stop:1253 length:927 start_codon:yes stop_codon:yes gene_type:complete